MGKKGSYIKKIIDNYCVLDIETTGLSWQKDMIIEVGIVKIRNQCIVDKYTMLVNPNCHISSFITRLTGISDQMVKNQPTIEEIKDDILQFIGDDVIIGHNTSFDLNFLIHHLNHHFQNSYMDTLQLSRKVYPQLKHHRLSDMVELLNLSNNEHRAIADCIATYELYEHLKNKILEQKITL